MQTIEMVRQVFLQTLLVTSLVTYVAAAGPTLTVKKRYNSYYDAEDIVLTCESDRHDVIDYEFWRDGSPVFIKFDNTYTISHTRVAAYVGSYTCVVYLGRDADTGKHSAHSNAISVSPAVTPTLTVQTSGESVTLTCNTPSGRYTNYAFMNGGAIHESTENKYTFDKSKIAARGFGFRTPSHFCTVYSDTAKSVESNAIVLTAGKEPQAIYTPTLTVEPKYPRPGGNFRLTCHTSPGATQIQFNRNVRGRLQVVGHSTDGTYTVKSAQVGKDDGLYWCTVTRHTSGGQSPKSKQVLVTMESPHTPTLTAVYDGSTFVLTCGDTSAGVTDYEFFRDGSPLVKSASNKYTPGTDGYGGRYTCSVYLYHLFWSYLSNTQILN